VRILFNNHFSATYVIKRRREDDYTWRILKIWKRPWPILRHYHSISIVTLCTKSCSTASLRPRIELGTNSLRSDVWWCDYDVNNWTVHSSSAVDGHKAEQKNPLLLLEKPKFHRRIRESAIRPYPGQLMYCLFRVNFNIDPPPHLRLILPSGLLSWGFPIKIVTHFSFLLCVLHISPISSFLVDHPSNIRRRIQIMSAFVMYFFLSFITEGERV